MGFQIFSGPIHLMRVGITGSSGFLGEALLGALNDASFGVVPIELPRTEVVLDGTFLEQQFSDLDVEAVFNLAAVRHPTNKYEYAVNAQLPILLQKALKRVRPSARFIHMSSINVVLQERSDPYSNSKRQAEFSLYDSTTIIIRPSIIWSWQENAGGDVGRLHHYLSRSLPFHPVPFPGQHYRPVAIDNFVSRLTELLGEKKPPTIINVFGDRPTTIWELAKHASKNTGSRLLPIPTGFLERLLPKAILNELPTAIRSTNAGYPNDDQVKPAETTWTLPFSLSL
jgi:nucleoside-diphosphate-sugar epimerase